MSEQHTRALATFRYLGLLQNEWVILTINSPLLCKEGVRGEVEFARSPHEPRSTPPWPSPCQGAGKAY